MEKHTLNIIPMNIINKVRGIFFIIIIFFFCGNVSSQINNFDPGGTMTHYIIRNMLGKLLTMDEVRLKAAKVKEVIVTDENDIVEQRSYYDREGREIEVMYNENAPTFPGQTQIKKYNIEGGLFQQTIYTKEWSFTMDIIYGEKYPDYILIKGDSIKPIRYDIEIKNGKIKSFTNNNFPNGTLKYLLDYHKDYSSYSIQVNEQKPAEVMHFNFSNDSISCIGKDLKIIWYIDEERIFRVVQYSGKKITLDVKYNYNEKGIPDSYTEEKFEGDSKKHKYTFVFYED